MTSDGDASVCVLAPEPLLTVEIEAARHTGGAEIHVHAGGQGLWVANMARSLGARVAVCGPFGGEPGVIAAHLLRDAGLDVRVASGPACGVVVEDRRGDDPTPVAVMAAEPPDRHSIDDLYGTTLVTALDSDVCVLTGAHHTSSLRPDFYARLARDLAAAGRTVVADLAGAAVHAVAVERLAVLKVSHDELVRDGLAPEDSPAALRRAAEKVVAQGPAAVVVSRAGDPACSSPPRAPGRSRRRRSPRWSTGARATR